MKKLLAVLAFLLLPTLAHALPITFGFTGEGSIILTHEAVSFTGDYTFDSDATGQPSLSRGTNYFFDSSYGMHITVGAITLDFSGLAITVLNDRDSGEGPADRYRVHSSGGGFSILSCSGNAFDSEALPLSINYAAAFSTGCFEREDHEFSGGGVIGNLTNLFVVTVPEPASWWLLGLGVIGMAMGRIVIPRREHG